MSPPVSDKVKALCALSMHELKSKISIVTSFSAQSKIENAMIFYDTE